ncbi:ester cyclase [Nocardioides sp. REDSEA-S30_B4]|uniref:ester cyclase n=1 Tax=Nocardioides sp. REDSEA-S30_B4 TaxID=1811552 RepID=UPI003459E862
MVRLFNEGDLDAAQALLSPRVVNHAAPIGTDSGWRGWRAFWESVRRGYPDFHASIEQTCEAGDIVATQYTMRGTHTDEFLGSAATGRRFEARAMDIMRVRDGQIVEHWGVSEPWG